MGRHQSAVASTYRRRLRRLRQALEAARLDALVVTDLTNVRYLSGFVGSAATLLVAEAKAIFFTDFRYVEATQGIVFCDEVRRTSSEPTKDLADAVRTLRLRRVGAESDHLSHDTFLQMAAKIGVRRLKPVKQVVERLRMIKDADEIAAIERSVRLGVRAFRHVRPLLRPGAAESDLVVELEHYVRIHGGHGAFSPIVAFGAAASRPHYIARRRRLGAGSMGLIDWGVALDGYCSDLTRTFLSHRMRPKEREVYAIVVEAHQRALEAIRPGVLLKEVDRTAREVIARHGFADQFGHSVGHGMGLKVHELPSVSARSTQVCQAGMVVAIEPAIYIPGWGGVRIEDDVLVTRRGARVLSRLTRQMEPTF